MKRNGWMNDNEVKNHYEWWWHDEWRWWSGCGNCDDVELMIMKLIMKLMMVIELMGQRWYVDDYADGDEVKWWRWMKWFKTCVRLIINMRTHVCNHMVKHCQVVLKSILNT